MYMVLSVQMDEVMWANDKLAFLLDTAEMRLRDAALTGWEHRGVVLTESIQKFVNGYLFEMIRILAQFFESKGMESVAGLQSKTSLITTFMRHNDRLEIILDSALQPYELTSEVYSFMFVLP
jgi:hypothetical protein